MTRGEKFWLSMMIIFAMIAVMHPENMNYQYLVMINALAFLVSGGRPSTPFIYVGPKPEKEKDDDH